MTIGIFRHILLVSSLISFFGSLSAQQETWVKLKVKGQYTSADEYRQFLKINDPAGEKTLKENSQEYLAYRLKLHEAVKLRLDTLGSFKSEVLDFRSIYARKYLDAGRLDEPRIREYYNRAQSEVEISHMRIDIDGDLYKDTLDEYLLIDSLRQLVLSGNDFQILAARYSDSKTASDSGYLGFITAMQLPFPLEELAYHTAPGSVSRIFRTSGSYHLMFTHQKVPARGTVRIIGMYKKGGEGYEESYNHRIKKELDSLRLLALNGYDFETLAKEHSDANDDEDPDPYMPPVRSRGKEAQLSEAAYQLPYDGAISSVIASFQGFYVIQRIEFIPLKDFNTMKEEIRNFYANNPTRKNYLHDTFLRSVLDYYGFNFYPEAYSRFVSYGRNSFQKGQWIEPEDLEKDRLLFELGDMQISFDDFSEYLGTQEFAYEFINYPPVVGKHFQDFFYKVVYDYQDQHLETRYAAFDSLMNQFRNTLLIRMIEDEILQQASQDQKGLKKQFAKNREPYVVQGFEGLIIQFSTMQERQKLEFWINTLELDPDILQDTLKSISSSLQTERVRVRRGENPVIDHFIWKQSKFEPPYSLMMVKGSFTTLPAENYQEVLPDVIFDYSEIYEEKYIQELKRKYNVRIKYQQAQ